MLVKTHIAFGILLGLLGVIYFEMSWLGFMFVLIGSVVLDVDVSSSKVGRKWYSRVLQLYVRHRGIVHSLIFVAVVSWLVGLWRVEVGWGLFVGFVGHLFLDCLTYRGVRLFWPLWFKVRGSVKVGKYFEAVLFAVLVFVDVGLVVKLVV